jgi:hypothetical protein
MNLTAFMAVAAVNRPTERRVAVAAYSDVGQATEYPNIFRGFSQNVWKSYAIVP